MARTVSPSASWQAARFQLGRRHPFRLLGTGGGQVALEPSRRGAGVLIGERSLRQFVQRRQVIGADLQDLLEVSKGGRAIFEQGQPMLRTLEQQRDPLAGRQRPGRQPIREEAVEGRRPPRRLQLLAEERVNPGVGARVVGAELDRPAETAIASSSRPARA